jgi:hypothetical protein
MQFFQSTPVHLLLQKLGKIISNEEKRYATTSHLGEDL